MKVKYVLNVKNTNVENVFSYLIKWNIDQELIKQPILSETEINILNKEGIIRITVSSYSEEQFFLSEQKTDI
jgi:hypothetical protein